MMSVWRKGTGPGVIRIKGVGRAMSMGMGSAKREKVEPSRGESSDNAVRWNSTDRDPDNAACQNSSDQTNNIMPQRRASMLKQRTGLTIKERMAILERARDMKAQEELPDEIRMYQNITGVKVDSHVTNTYLCVALRRFAVC